MAVGYATLKGMTTDRRGAPRHAVPEDVVAEIGGVPAKLLELSLIGAKVEHHDRFSLVSTQLAMTWRGNAASVAVRAARSEIVGRQGARLVYQTGLYFVDLSSIARGFIASILDDETLSAEVIPAKPDTPEPPGAAESERRSPDDTWTRRVQLLKQELDEDFPYAQFRLGSMGWQKEYVESPAQPADGFTIPRQRHDFHELQRAFEAADEETRRMMQIALESQLKKLP